MRTARWTNLLTSLVLLYGGMAAGTLLLQVAFGGDLVPLLRLWPAHDPNGPVIDLAAGLGLGLVVVLLTRSSGARWRWARTLDQEFRQLLAHLGPEKVVVLAGLSSVGEELLFRGFLQPIIGLTIASVVFGLVHVPHRKAMLPWTFAAVVMGFAFGGLYAWRGALLAPISAHFTINFFNLHHLLRPLAAGER